VRLKPTEFKLADTNSCLMKEMPSFGASFFRRVCTLESEM